MEFTVVEIPTPAVATVAVALFGLSALALLAAIVLLKHAHFVSSIVRREIQVIRGIPSLHGERWNHIKDIDAWFQCPSCGHCGLVQLRIYESADHAALVAISAHQCGGREAEIGDMLGDPALKMAIV